MQKMNMFAMATASAALVLLAPAGCDKSQQDSLKEQAAEAQKKAGEASSEAIAQAKAGWENLKTQYAPQVDQMNEKLTKLKADAAQFKDTQLDGYIAQIDEKLSNVKGKLAETFSTEGFESMKAKIGPWIDEVKSLYDKAAARLAELVKGASTPAPGG